MIKRNRNFKGWKTDSDLLFILEKIRHFCSYRERSEKEAELRLKSMKVPSAKIKQILKQLREDGFLSDERFARAYVRGKWRVNQWGRVKIAFELKAKGIPEKLIHSSLIEIDKDSYRETLEMLIRKKTDEFHLRQKKENISKKSLNIRDKIFNFALGKGYEPDLIDEILHELKI